MYSTTVATAKGHMHTQHSNIQSTKGKPNRKYHLYNALTPSPGVQLAPNLILPDDDDIDQEEPS